jgi:hypothetical protein
VSKANITEFEDAIVVAKQEFSEKFKDMLTLVKNPQVNESLIQEALNELHSKAVNYFDLFGRSITEYGLENFKLDKNIRDSKCNDAVNIANSIIKYWKLLSKINKNFNIIPPKASERAYSTIQLFIKTFDSEKAEELKTEFQSAGLPIHGFESNQTFFDMTKKQQITYGVIVGTLFLIALLVIVMNIDCPTEAQSNVFTTILALSAAAFSTVIPGSIDMKYRNIVTAGGSLAVFVLVFLFKPATLSDFAHCTKTISGTIYLGSKPQSSVELKFLKLNQSTITDNFGSFNLRTDLSNIDDTLYIQLKNEDLKIDTIVSIEKSKLSTSLDIYLQEFCVLCVMKNNMGSVIRSIQRCSPSKEFITQFIQGYSHAGREQGLVVECNQNQ